MSTHRGQQDCRWRGEATTILVGGLMLLACTTGSTGEEDVRGKDASASETGPAEPEDAADAGPDTGVQCNHDCECYGLGLPLIGGGWYCVDHRCRGVGVPPRYLCATAVPPGESPFWCACRGGGCDGRGCCVLAGGRIPYLTDPECQPAPDAGQRDGG